MKRPPKQISAFRLSNPVKDKLKHLCVIYDKTMTDVLVMLIEERHKAKTREHIKLADAANQAR